MTWEENSHYRTKQRIVTRVRYGAYFHRACRAEGVAVLQGFWWLTVDRAFGSAVMRAQEQRNIST